MTEKACSVCMLITTENICPNCRASSLSDDFSGLVVIFDPEGSVIAKAMEIREEGQYALKVR